MTNTHRYTHLSLTGFAALVILLSRVTGQEEASQPAPPKHTNVYKSQFDKVMEIGMWSEARPGKAPNGLRFLGPYSGRKSLYQSNSKLPAHRYVRLRFDLLILHSWDGETESGPDLWALSVQGGPLLMCTAFGNKIKVVDPDRIARGDQARMPKLQSFPDEFPLMPNKVATGASPEGPKLGFKFYRDDIEVESSIYQMDLIFPHAGEELVLHYLGNIDGEAKDECWGLNYVIIDTIDREMPQSDEQLAQLWSHLSGRDAVAANAALWTLIATGPKGLAFVEKSYQALKVGAGGKNGEDKALRDRFAEILKTVTAENFVTRQQAQANLLALGEKALPLLEAEIRTTQDPEVRRALRAAAVKLRKKVSASGEPKHFDVVTSRVEHIRRIFQTHANGYKITSSVADEEFPNDPVGAAADGFVPASSGIQIGPRFTWHPEKGTEEWLQYEFPKAKSISAAEVYWFSPRGENTDLPESWKVQYKAADGSWKEVAATGKYTLEPDKMNRVTFKQIKTSAVRLVVKLPEGETGGVHEFRVSDPKSSD